jgi:hypothetical protein
MTKGLVYINAFAMPVSVSDETVRRQETDWSDHPGFAALHSALSAFSEEIRNAADLPAWQQEAKRAQAAIMADLFRQPKVNPRTRRKVEVMYDRWLLVREALARGLKGGAEYHAAAE